MLRRKNHRGMLLVLVTAISIVACYALFTWFGAAPSSASLLSPLHSHFSNSPTSLPILVIFGDSWSDDASRPLPADRAARVAGDEFYAVKFREGRSARRFGAGLGGRWSDGPVWPEYICEAVRCADYLNLAVGGAKVTNNYVPSLVPDLVQQKDNFLAIKEADSTIVEKDGSPTDELVDNRRTLFVFWFGINDLIQYISVLPTSGDRQRAVVSSVATLFDIATALAGRFPQSNFLFVSSIDVTLLPFWSERMMANDLQLRKYKEVVRLSETWRLEMTKHAGNWNSSLASIQYWDANDWLARSISGVAKNGFENLKDACFDHDSRTLCPTPEKYFFWDHIHLTTAAHKDIAARLKRLNLWRSMSNVP
ncbi:hypothetical protein POJ06DRAFT_268761 [Lipomyces tetrasporus]|uniref:GDSL esterase/lipase n=1 Tax=Lipomyces tetrasporus TaxID=54092 RepID=A0AAD7QQT9_9ASCO|nr:uncharacterized protein POJ06DRAFT_268761 [Lipomyces tetrasporus]KAJ8099882.1 hypothetical protein POJ06DRAFT_268761 [Lipomyces tetrasporus]